MLTIEAFPYTDEAYQVMAAIDAAVFGDHPVPVEELKHDDATRNPDFLFQRDLIRRDGEVIAFGAYGQNQWAYHPQKVDCRVFVDPRHDGPDIRPAYLDHVLAALRGRDIIAITSGMLEDKPEAMRFFAEHGFVEVAREALSELDVTRFDPGRFADLLARLQAEGIEIVRLPALQARDPDWRRKLYALELLISADVPSTGGKQPHTFESWVAARLNGPAFDPEGWFVALDGERYVGESQGSINQAEPDRFQTGLTGVRRDYRRRGIATALKLHVIDYARQHKIARIVTNNDSQNPMYQLNLALGFVPQPAWVRVEKALVGE